VVFNPPIIGVVGLSPPPVTIQGIQWIHYPLIKVSPVHPLPDLQGFDWLFWSSKQAIAATRQSLPPAASHATLGQAETQALARLSITANWQSTVAVGVKAAQAFAAFLPGGRTILWPCNNRGNPAILTALGSHGHAVTKAVVYHSHPITMPVPTQPVDAWLFTSPSAVEAFVINQWVCRQPVGVLGPTTAQCVTQLLGTTPYVAQPSGHWASVLHQLATAVNR
jgi:uroporphyrinogen-III synthase